MPIIAALAAITIVGGNLMALPQQNTKRLLAYSGIAHIGYMLVGFAAASASGMAMVLFYLVAYVFGNMGAFLVVEAVARSERSEATVALRGLAQRSPLLALAMLLFLLSLGGIPFVAGFWAKLYVFWAAAAAGLYWLVLVGAVLSGEPADPRARLQPHLARRRAAREWRRQGQLLLLLQEQGRPGLRHPRSDHRLVSRAHARALLRGPRGPSARADPLLPRSPPRDAARWQLRGRLPA